MNQTHLQFSAIERELFESADNRPLLAEYRQTVANLTAADKALDAVRKKRPDLERRLIEARQAHEARQCDLSEVRREADKLENAKQAAAKLIEQMADLKAESARLYRELMLSM